MLPLYHVTAHAPRRVVLQDHAQYPEPLLNALQYHAIGCCRDMLLERTASRLGDSIGARFDLRSSVFGVVALLFGNEKRGATGGV